jgi:hypothetical protein
MPYGPHITRARKPKASSQAGSSARAIRTHTSPHSVLETIMTRCRSNRSAIAPATGRNSPSSPNVSRNVSESQTTEFVRRYTSTERAISPAPVPTNDTNPANASLRTAALFGAPSRSSRPSTRPSDAIREP